MKMDKPTKQLAIEVLSYLPTRPDYEIWIKVISAIGNSFDEATALDILLTKFRDEAPNEHLYKLRNSLEKINFGTLVYIAMDYGYKPSHEPKNGKLGHYSRAESKQKICKVRTTISIGNEVYYDYSQADKKMFEALVNQMIKDENCDRETAINHYKLQFSSSPSIQKERVFSLMINGNLIDKPSADVIRANQHKFNKYRITLKELIQCIGKGYAILPSVLSPNDKGKFERKAYLWQYSDLLFLDVDGSITIDEALSKPEIKQASFLYTTPSHTNEKHRFRIVFALSGRVRDVETYKAIHLHYSNIFRADKNCKDTSRFYFGNRNAIIYDIQTSEIITNESINYGRA